MTAPDFEEDNFQSAFKPTGSEHASIESMLMKSSAESTISPVENDDSENFYSLYADFARR
jgi:hypothetical protein